MSRRFVELVFRIRYILEQSATNGKLKYLKIDVYSERVKVSTNTGRGYGYAPGIQMPRYQPYYPMGPEEWFLGHEGGEQ